MDTITIKHLDNINLGILCDTDQKLELKDFFSFYAHGYKYDKRYRDGKWDGKISLFNLKTQKLPIGLLYKIKKFCDDRKYDYDFEPHDTLPSLEYDKKITEDRVKKFIKSIDLPFEPYDYQYNAILQAIRSRRITIKSPTGTGKSLIIYCLLRWFMEESPDERFLVVVPTTSLVEQMYQDFREYGFNSKKYCKRLYSKSPDDFKSKYTILISTWQSIYENDEEWFQQFSGVFGDEVHGFKAKSLISLMNKCCNANVRVGTTGTFDKTEVHKLQVEALFGPIFVATTTKKEQDNKRLAPLTIKVINLKYPKSVREYWYERWRDACKTIRRKKTVNGIETDVGDGGKKFRKLYQDEVNYIIGNDERNEFICQLTTRLKGNTLLLFQYVDKHGKILYKKLKREYKDRKIFYVYGGVETNDRERIRRIVSRENNAIIVASLGTFSTGINIKNLNNIIFASPWKAIIKVLQSIGRVLRLSPDGMHSTLFDIWDDFSLDKYINYSQKHGKEKISIYESEKFIYMIDDIKLELKDG